MDILVKIIMKKSILIISILFFILIPYLSGAQTEKNSSIYPIPDGNVLGQSQYYSVVFDGEGEAAVAVKYAIQNSGEEDIKKIVLEIPGSSIRMINAVQEVYGKDEKTCNLWEDACVKKDSEGVCLKYERNCSSWAYQPVRYNPIYHTLKPQTERLSNSVKYTFELSESIVPQGSSSIVLYYKATGYAKKGLGVFKFKFETIKSNFDVNQVRVAVNVQEGFYLKGGDAKTQYQRQAFDFSALESAGELKGVESSSIGSFSQNIIYQQGYVKQTSGLDPWESFTVEGRYSSSRFLLNLKLIAIFLAVAAGIILAIWLAVKKIIKKSGETSHPTETGQSGEISLSPGNKQAEIAKKDIFLKILLGGGGGAAGALAIIFSGQYLVKLMVNLVGYQYENILGIMLVLALGILFLISVFGPAVVIGRKYGLKYGIWTIVVTVITIIFLSVIITVILASFSGGGIIQPLIY